MSAEQLRHALDIMRRMPPANTSACVDDLCDLVPDLTEELLSTVDQPLRVETDRDARATPTVRCATPRPPPPLLVLSIMAPRPPPPPPHLRQLQCRCRPRRAIPLRDRPYPSSRIRRLRAAPAACRSHSTIARSAEA